MLPGAVLRDLLAIIDILRHWQCESDPGIHLSQIVSQATIGICQEKLLLQQ
jgi:hypothetical protein